MRRIATALGVALIATGAQAAIITNFSSSPGFIGLGAFDASMEWDYSGPGRQGMLYVTIENTSDPVNGGYVTAFGFNTIDGLRLQYRRSENGEGVSPHWKRVRNVDADPFGPLHHGLALYGQFRGHRDPSEGIATGATRTFAFRVRARQSVLQELSPLDFLDESSGEAFVARYTGFESGHSDLVNAALPAPGALPLLAMGLGAARRRRAR